jgi:hypothetical protein
VNTLPPSLVRFESQLEDAVRRERGRRPRRLVVRTCLAAAAAAAVALGVFSALPGNSPSVVQRAEAALRNTDGAILHVVLTGTLNGTPTRLETWEQSSPPNDQRGIFDRGDRVIESAVANGVQQLYDPATNTIYVGEPAQGKGASSKAGAVAENAQSDRYRAKILALLQSGQVHEDGHVWVPSRDHGEGHATVRDHGAGHASDGRDSIRLASNDGTVWLLVDASTYDPIEWHVSQDGQTADATFPTFERLAETPANEALLSLTAQHPGARVDRDPSGYAAALQRVAGKTPGFGDGADAGAKK